MQKSRCPQLNDLLRSAEDHQRGVKTPEDVKDSLRAMESLYSSAVSFHQQQLQRHDKTEPWWQAAPALEAELRRLRQGLEAVREWCDTLSPIRLVEGLEETEAATEALIALFERIQQQEQAAPPLSPNPAMHEVLRVSRAVAEGKLPANVLADALGRMKLLLKESYQAMSGPVPDEQVPTHKEALRLMELVYARLKEAQQYLDDNQMDPVRRSLESVRLAILELHTLKERAEVPADEGEALTCWRCGEDVPPPQMTCPACGFRFPVTAKAGSAGLFVLDEAATLTPGGHAATEVTERLCVAMEAVRGGQPGSILSAALDEARARVDKARRHLQALPPVLGEDAVLAEEDSSTVRESLELMERGLDRMARYVSDRDPRHLAEGLEIYLVGSDQLLAIQAPG